MFLYSLTPYNLCISLLICLLVRKQPSYKHLLSIYLIKLIKKNIPQGKSLEDLLYSLNSFLNKDGNEVSNWLSIKINSINSPDSIEDLIDMIKDTIQIYFFNNNSSKESIFGIFLQEIILSYDKLFFSGISRLFTQLQCFGNKYNNNNNSQDSLSLETDSNSLLLSMNSDNNLLSIQDISSNYDSCDNNFWEINNTQDSIEYNSFNEHNISFNEHNSENFKPSDSSNHIGDFGSENPCLNLPHSPVLGVRKPLGVVIDNSFNDFESFDSLNSHSDLDDETPSLMDDNSLSFHHWNELENSWFPELVKIRLRRCNSLSFGLTSPYEVREQIIENIKELTKQIQNITINNEISYSLYDIEDLINLYRSQIPTETSIHYLSFLLKIKQRNYSQALDELHRYFDYQLFAILSNSKQKNLNILPFAVLSLASLCYEFENYEEGLISIIESIKMSQERSDDSNLVRSFYWLYCYLKENISNNNNNNNQYNIHNNNHNNHHIILNKFSLTQNHKNFLNILERAINRAKEQKLYHWEVLTLLSISELLLNHPNNNNNNNNQSNNWIKQKFSYLSSSSSLITQHEIIWNLLSQINSLIPKSDIQNLSTKLSLLKSSIWNQYAHKDLDLLYTQISYLNLYKESNNNTTNNNTNIISNINHNENIILVICKLALQYMLKGNWDDSFNILLEYSSNINYKSQKLYLSTCLYILLEYIINNGQYKLAKNILLEQNLYFDTFTYYNILSSIALEQEDYYYVFNTINNIMFPFSNELPLSNWKNKIQCYILLSESYINIKQPLLALSNILTVISLSKKYNAHQELIKALLLLTEIHLLMKHEEKALSQLLEIESHIMHHCPLKIKGKYHLQYGIILLSLSIKNKTKQSYKYIKNELTKAYLIFNQLNILKYIQKTEYYLSLYYNYINNIKKRDNIATKYIQTTKQLDNNISLKSLINSKKANDLLYKLQNYQYNNE